VNVTTEATFSRGDGFPRAQPRGPETAFGGQRRARHDIPIIGRSLSNMGDPRPPRLLMSLDCVDADRLSWMRASPRDRSQPRYSMGTLLFSAIVLALWVSLHSPGVEAQFESLQAAAYFPESGDVLLLAVVGRRRKALSLNDKVRLVFRELAGSGEGGKQ